MTDHKRQRFHNNIQKTRSPHLDRSLCTQYKIFMVIFSPLIHINWELNNELLHKIPFSYDFHSSTSCKNPLSPYFYQSLTHMEDKIVKVFI